MTTEPLTPQSLAALAKEVLGYEHTNVKVTPRGVWYGRSGMTPADALTLIAAGAWGEIKRANPYFRIDCGSLTMWRSAGTFAKPTVKFGDGDFDQADPANVAALLLAMKEKGVRCGVQV